MRNLKRKQGQGMTEYIIIIAIIAIGAILIVGLFGQQIKNVFAGMTGSLGGKTAVGTSKASALANSVGASATKENMSTYDQTQ